MAEWLTAEWFDLVVALASGQPEHPGLMARVQHEVTGGPSGDVRYVSVIVDGRLIEHRIDGDDHPDVTLTVAWADARALAIGELDPSAAYMQGRLKAAGSMALWLELLALAATPEHHHLRGQIAEATEVSGA